jgi:hypothetical protein
MDRPGVLFLPEFELVLTPLFQFALVAVMFVVLLLVVHSGSARANRI